MPVLTVASRPYPWPWHGRFDPSRTAAVFFAGDEGIGPTARLALAWERFAAEARALGCTIVASPPATAPAAVPVDPDLVIARQRYGGFTGADFDLVLRVHRLTDLVIAGAPFELGADCTMRQANDLGYECLALEDLSEGLAPDTLAGAISSVQMSGGIFGATATAAEFLAMAQRHTSTLKGVAS